MIIKSTLPKDWEIKKLGEVCLTTSGGTPSRKDLKYYKGDIPWVKSGELDKGLIIDTEEKISEEAIKNSSAKVFPKGTLLIALYGATIGKLAFLGIDAATNQAVCGIFKSEAVESKFLYYFLFSQRPSLVKQSIGGAQPNISQGILKDLEIPLPPFAEQERIVAKIEELFSELDAGTVSLKTARQQLKIYRQAVLKWAFEGKLTNEKLNDGELPEGWKSKKLGDVVDLITKGASPKWQGINYVQDSTQILFVTSENIRENYVDISKPKYVEIAFNEKQKRSILKKGDVLLNIVGASIGRAAIFGLNILANINQAVSLIRLKSDISQKFICYYLNSNSARNFYNLNKVDFARANLSLTDVSNIPVSLPTFEEQQRIVQEIESRLSVCDKLEETINQSLQQAESLRQSILKKAFEGKLLAAEKETEALSEKQIKFHQLQVLGLILVICKVNGIRHGQMTSAKYLYLLDKIFGIKTYYNFKRGNLGPFPSDFKKTVYNKQYFVHNYKNQIEVVNETRLFNSPNPYQQEIENALDELSGLFLSFESKDRSHKTELLATVCKVIEDIQTTELEAVRQSMAEWKIDLRDRKFNNKAEKFDEKETAKCIAFIIKNGWDKKLIN